MELLIGAIHCEEFLDDVVDVINQRYPNTIESLMLEIPSNWEEIEDYYLSREEFFFRLADIYIEAEALELF